MKNKVCFTGHRPEKIGGYDQKNPKVIIVRESLKKEIELLLKIGHRYFISGMSLGVDQMAVEILLDLKPSYPDIIIEAAIPCLNQQSRWPEFAQEYYLDLISCCDKLTYVSKENYTQFCMNARNKYMVDVSSVVVAVFNGAAGGTKNTIEYAKKQNKNIILIKP